MVGDNKVGIVTEYIAESLALGTGAEWMVEGKKDRTNRLEGSATLLAAIVRTVGSGALVDHFYEAEAFALSECGFDRFDQARPVVFPDHQPIEDHMEVIRPGFWQAMGFVEIKDLRIASHSAKAAEQE
jgi:hypothetical protein